MPEGLRVAVIDIGKTNAKVALVDTTEALELDVLKTPSATRDGDLYPCLDESAIMHFIEQSLAQLSRHSRIDALTVTTHGATVALVDAEGELALPVLDYEFTGVEELAADYDAVRPPFSETGSPRLPAGLNVGAQLYWQAQRYPERFHRTSSILTWPQYWVFRLCAARCNEVSSLGAHTDLYAPHRKAFSSLVDSQGWGALMPPILPSGTAVGTLREDIRSRTGMHKALPVHVGIHDSNASLVPCLLGGTDAFSVVSTGTWTICMSIGGEPVTLDERRDCLFNVNAFGDAVASARFMGGREREVILQAEPPARTAPSAMSSEETQRQAALQRLLQRSVDTLAMVMPTAVNGTGPFPDAHWTWIDSKALTDAAERDCCVSFYLALMTAQCLALIGRSGPIHVEGPCAHDTLYTRMLMAATHAPVFASLTATGTSVGAAMLISHPRLLPTGTPVELDAAERLWMRQYAERWRLAVARHTKLAYVSDHV